jgi:capsular polysaccharide biosynthesis protein
MHGAGMTHLIFLPDEAVVVEMFPKGWHQSSMRNLAKLTNKVYLGWQNTHDKNIVEENSNIIDKEEFKTLANSAVHVALSFHLGKGFL